MVACPTTSSYAIARRLAVLCAPLALFVGGVALAESPPATLEAPAAPAISGGISAVESAPIQKTRFPQGLVSAADPRAAEAGAEILRKDGSAVDAALATLLALTVVEPQSSGIGGGGFLLMDDGQGNLSAIDGRETAPAAAHGAWFQKDGKPMAFAEAFPGGLSVGVPGNVALMAMAHRQNGVLKWAELFGPAIKLARDGFEITPRLHRFLVANNSTAGLTEEARVIYYQADGTAKPVGTRITNPALAIYLDKLAKNGIGAFYSGANARSIVEAVSMAPVNPAPMTVEDIAAYRAKLRDPVCSEYRGWRVCGMGPPSSGATTVQGVLGMLEPFDLAKWGQNSVISWHLIAEAQRLAYADRERYLADSDFVSVPVKGLMAPDYWASRAQLIAPDTAMEKVEAGLPEGAPKALGKGLEADVPSTSHFVVIDKNGQAVSLTSTIEGPFGSGLMVNGYYLNNELTDFSFIAEKDGELIANRVEANKRPRSSMAPTLVYDPEGNLRFVVGAAGGATIPAQVIKSIIGVVDWGLSAEDALALPVIFAPGGDTVFVEKGSILEEMVPALQDMGHKDVRLRDPSFKTNAVEVVEGALKGAADPRSEGAAASE